MARHCLLTLILLSAALAEPPVAPTWAVTDTYHGVRVTDEYRWLENYKDSAGPQNAHARKILDVFPSRELVLKELNSLLERPNAHCFRLTWIGNTLFAPNVQPPKEQPVLVILGSAANVSNQRVVFDSNCSDKPGRTRRGLRLNAEASGDY